MPPTRTVIEDDVTLEPLRAWASRSVLFGTAWGYGLILVLMPLVSMLGYLATLRRQGVVFSVSQDFLLRSLSDLIATAIGMFVAGVVARTILKTRTGDRLATTVTQAGLAFVLSFPAMAAVMTLFHRIRNIDSSYVGWPELWSYFQYQWWGRYAALGLMYAIGISLITAAWRYLPLSRPAAFQPLPLARLRRRRPREVAAGLVLIALFVIVGIDNFISLTEHARSEAQSLNDRWKPDAATLRTIADIGAIRTLPIAFVGLLLLTPLRWRRA